jgi:hypothetical protein
MAAPAACGLMIHSVRLRMLTPSAAKTRFLAIQRASVAAIGPRWDNNLHPTNVRFAVAALRSQVNRNPSP